MAMDILVPEGVLPVIRPLGRDTAATVNSKPVWSAMIAAAPHLFHGTSDTVQVSPPIYKYCPGGFNNQWIGCCVGEGSKNAAATMLRIPANAVFNSNDPTKDSPPLPTIDLSALYCYLNARYKGTLLGQPPGNRPNDPNGGGAVVAFALLAMEEWGVLPQAAYPDTEANQLACADGPLTPLFGVGQTHLIMKGNRITSQQQYLDFLAQGFPVVDGVPITQGWMTTADDGAFSLAGRIVGGHCTVTVGYDKTLNRLYKRNSWAGWGARTTDPQFQGAANGYNNIGYCPLDQYLDTNLTAQAFSSGETDAYVLTAAPEGFTQANITDVTNVDVFA